MAVIKQPAKDDFLFRKSSILRKNRFSVASRLLKSPQCSAPNRHTVAWSHTTYVILQFNLLLIFNLKITASSRGTSQAYSQVRYRTIVFRNTADRLIDWLRSVWSSVDSSRLDSLFWAIDTNKIRIDTSWTSSRELLPWCSNEIRSEEALS